MTFFTKQWDHWWLRKAPPHALAILRAGFGLFLIIEAATYLPFISMMFSSEGFAMSMVSGLPPSFAVLLAPPPPIIAWAIACIYILAALCLALGYQMRTALTVLLLLFLYYWQLSFYLFPSSYHRIFFFLLLVLLFSGADKTFSVRMKLARGSWFAWEPISVLPQRLIAVQLTATYAVVGLQKWWLPLWQGGEVMYYSFITRWGSPLARWIVRLGWPMPFYDALTLSTKVLETILPVGFWIPRVRWFCFAAGAVFHILIALLLQIWWFLVLIPAYVVFFEPEAVYAFCRRHLPAGRQVSPNNIS